MQDFVPCQHGTKFIPEDIMFSPATGTTTKIPTGREQNVVPPAAEQNVCSLTVKNKILFRRCQERDFVPYQYRSKFYSL